MSIEPAVTSISRAQALLLGYFMEKHLLSTSPTSASFGTGPVEWLFRSTMFEPSYLLSLKFVVAQHGSLHIMPSKRASHANNSHALTTKRLLAAKQLRMLEKLCLVRFLFKTYTISILKILFLFQHPWRKQVPCELSFHCLQSHSTVENLPRYKSF